MILPRSSRVVLNTHHHDSMTSSPPRADSPSLAGQRLGRVGLFLDGGWIDRARAQRAYASQVIRDKLGYSVMIWMNAVMMALACLPDRTVEISVLAVQVYWIMRLWSTWRTAWRPMFMPLGLALAAFVFWSMIATSWSLDPHHGWNEFGKLRWLSFVLVLWPVMDQRAVLIRGLCAGLLLGNLSQVGLAIARHFNIYNPYEFFTGHTLDWMTDHDRLGGWWHPLAAGSMLVAALGLHLPAALMGAGRTRVVAAVLAAVSLIGIIATGTRGALLAACGLLFIAAVVMVIKARPKLRTLGLGFAALVIVGGLGMATLGGRIMRRADMAIREVSDALHGQNLTSDNGARVQMAQWAIQAVRERPLTGIGAGGYQAFCRAQLVAAGKDPESVKTFEHAHNSLLHIAATLGLVGVGLALCVVVTSLWGAFADLSREQWGTYAAGPGMALVGMYLVSMTDPVHFNTQTAILLGILLALSPVWKPARPAALVEGRS